MKVIHLEDEPWDSGIAHYALTICAALARRGHDVHFWGRKDSYPLRKAQELGLPTLAIEHPWVNLGSLRAKVKDLGALLNPHTGSAHSLAAALGRPIVRTRGDAREPKRHALASALASRTSAFVAANTRIQGGLRAAFPGSRVELIPQGIEAGAPPPLPEEPVFGVLGRLDPVKGHEAFLAGASTLTKAYPKARFICAGYGRPERAQALREKASLLSLGATSEFLGFVEDSAAFRARCRVGVVSSIGSEAVSRAALEWMAAGRAVIATSVGGLPDIVEDGRTGVLVQPENPHALAAAMKRFLDEPELAARLGAEGRKRFEKRFSVEPFAQATERLYEEILHDLPS